MTDDIARAYREGAEWMREQAEKVALERQSVYATKANQHDALADSVLTPHEMFTHTAEAHDWLVSALRAIPLPDAPPRESRVKPLEWRDRFAHTDAGIMYVVDAFDEWAVLLKCEGSSTIKSAHPSVEAAKAAAKADYERRILSALTEQPREVSAAEAAKVLLPWLDRSDWMTVKEVYRADGKPSKHDICPHGHRIYEGCEACLEAAIRALAEPDEKEGT